MRDVSDYIAAHTTYSITRVRHDDESGHYMTLENPNQQRIVVVRNWIPGYDGSDILPHKPESVAPKKVAVVYTADPAILGLLAAIGNFEPLPIHG